MQGIKYIVKIWLSGLLFTPVVYLLLLVVFSGFHLPATIGAIVSYYVIPYAFLMSVWVTLGLLATIRLSANSESVKRNLSITGFLIPFATMLMINSISALQSYGGGYLLALAYAINAILFVRLYRTGLSVSGSQKAISRAIKDSIIYGLMVWLFTFLFSTPVSVLAWIFTQDFKPTSTAKTAQDILERYNIQLSLSIAYFITVALTSVIVIKLDITENKKKAIILLFAFPICFPVLFYYLLFSGEICAHGVFELLELIFPSIIISALSIWLTGIIPREKKKD